MAGSPTHSSTRSRGLCYLCCMGAGAAGRNAYFLVMAWIVVDTSRGPGLVAAFLAAGCTAEILTSNLGGLVADRFNRRLVCLLCDLLRLAVIAGTLIGLAQEDPVAVLAFSWIVYSIIDRTHQTALQAMLPSVTGETGLTTFNAVAYIAMQAGNLLAVVATGAILVSGPQYNGLIVSLVCFALSILSLVSTAPLKTSVFAEKTRVRFAECLPTNFPASSLRESAAFYALIYAMGMLVNALAAALVVQQLKGSALHFSYLEVAWSAGSISGCLLMIVFKPRRNYVAVLLTGSGIVLIGFLIIKGLTASIIQMLLLGIAYNAARIMIDVEAQRLVPCNMLGRTRGQIHTWSTAAGLIIYGLVAIVGAAIEPAILFGCYGLLISSLGLVAVWRDLLQRVATSRLRVD